MRFLVSVLIAFGLVACGCTPARPTVASGQSIPVEIRSTSPVTILNARAVRIDGQVQVSGMLRRPATTALPGHVDVIFLGSDGSRLSEQRITISGLGSRRGGVHEVPFAATVDVNLPAGSRAVFAYHAQL